MRPRELKMKKKIGLSELGSSMARAMSWLSADAGERSNSPGLYAWLCEGYMHGKRECR